MCGVLLFCLICDACSWRCSFIGSICVSLCRCCAPSCYSDAMFCVICSLLMLCLMLVVTIWLKHTRVWVLLWLCMLARMVSFCFPHVVDVSALSICIVLRAFVVVISM